MPHHTQAQQTAGVLFGTGKNTKNEKKTQQQQTTDLLHADDFSTVSQQLLFLFPSYSQSIIERVCELLHCPTSLPSTSGFSQSVNASSFPLQLSHT